MADYFPLLSRALDALPDRSPEMRNAVYERARGALVGQLRSLDPPLSDADIDHERRQLDAAIARLEVGYGADPVEPDEIPEEATLPAGPPLAAVRPPLLPEPGPPQAALAVLPPRREAPRPAEAEEGAALPAEEGAKRPRLQVRRPRDRAATLRKSAGVAALAVVVALIAVAAWLLRDKPSDLPVVSTEGIGRIEDGDAKFAERVGGERAASPAASAAAAPGASAGAVPPAAKPAGQAEPAAAPRAVLYEEDPANPQAPRVIQGRASWRLDAVNAQGQPLETVIRGTIEAPEAGLSLGLTVRRNTDANLPASHTIELVFTTSGPNGAARAVREVGVPQLKAEEGARGAPLAGLPVPVRDNLFLIGLSNPSADAERNVDLLSRRPWFDLPLRYAAGGRAVLSFEKGAAGERAFADALAQWR